MALALVGIGLNDAQDITLKGKKIIDRADMVYLEIYTSRMVQSLEQLSAAYGKPILPADRRLMEQDASILLDQAREKEVAVLIMGDVFSATTHLALYLKAREEGIPCQVVHNASVLTAVGITGLELYKFGKTTSLPFPEGSHQPDSYIQVIKDNQSLGYHTLVLLDLRPAEDRFMTVPEALKHLIAASDRLQQPILNKETKIVGCARLGGDATILYGPIEQLMVADFGPPPHCLIIPGNLHFLEEEALAQWRPGEAKPL